MEQKNNPSPSGGTPSSWLEDHSTTTPGGASAKREDKYAWKQTTKYTSHENFQRIFETEKVNKCPTKKEKNQDAAQVFLKQAKDLAQYQVIMVNTDSTSTRKSWNREGWHTLLANKAAEEEIKQTADKTTTFCQDLFYLDDEGGKSPSLKRVVGVKQEGAAEPGSLFPAFTAYENISFALDPPYSGPPKQRKMRATKPADGLAEIKIVCLLCSTDQEIVDRSFW